MIDSIDALSTKAHFELICAGLDEYEHLTAPSDVQHELDASETVSDEDHVASLDAKILAGLVHP